MTDSDQADDTDENTARDFRARLHAVTDGRPPLPPPADRVRRGRRALRRRRAARGVAGVVAAAVIGGGATWAVGVFRDDSAADPAAGSSVDPCPVLPPMTAGDAAALPDVEPSRKLHPYAANDPAAYDSGDGSFDYRPGLRGLEHLTGTLTRPGHRDTRWDAVELEGTNGRWYGLMTFTRNDGPGGGGGGSTTYRRVEPGRPSLAQWVTLHLEVRTDSPQDVLDVDDDGALVAAGGGEILQQAAAPDLVPFFGRGESIRLAELRRGPYTCFVVADTNNPETTDGDTSYYLVPPEYAGGTSLQDLAVTVAEVRDSVF